MSYLSPTSWTDVDSAGNPLNWSSRKQKLLYPAYEMLRRAMNSRVDGVGINLPAIKITNEMKPEKLGMSTADKNTFQFSMSQMMGDAGWNGTYLNHTDSGGDWSGGTDLDLKLWTIADILSEISEARIGVTKHFSADWEIQQYKMLNLLRWSRYISNDWDVSYKQGVGDWKATEALAWADAQTKLSSASWNVTTVANWRSWANMRIGGAGDYRATIQVARSTKKVGWGFDFPLGYDLYMRAGGGSGFYQGYPNLTNGIWEIAFSGTMPAGATNYDMFGGNGEMTHPPQPLAGGTTECGLQFAPVAVFKHDFKFKDW